MLIYTNFSPKNSLFGSTWRFRGARLQGTGLLVNRLGQRITSTDKLSSLIYHACDGPGLSILCFMKYEILEYFSVYGTSISIWVTLLALGDFDEPKRSTLTMFGVLTSAVRIYQDRWGYGVYSGPIGTAVLMITVKWLQKMKEKKGLYPEKSVYTQQVGPGCCFGALALMLRFYFEEWDYAYVHSFYHLSMAVSFVLLLPKKNRYAGTGRNAAKLNCYTLCCCV
uniref:Protein myomaker n=1 Tax=Astyanax mexicanus TaxID=7994 RepID=A0A8B9LN14_ASTMX